MPHPPPQLTNLTVRRVKKWPPLAWACKVERDPANITVWCGAFVEQTENSIFEAVWDGTVSPIDLDQSSLVCGTGLVIRDKIITFVTSSNTVDRIWLIKTVSGGWVGNSLPALLAVSGSRLKDDYLSYDSNLTKIIHGIDQYVRQMPLHDGTIEVLYFQNMVYDQKNWQRVDKNDNSPPFISFDTYYNYLLTSASLLASNASSKQRAYPIEMLTTISRGYDSPTAAIIARHAGCRKALTLTRARSIFARNDSGANIARRLNLDCEEYERPSSISSEAEPYFWAVLGEPADANFSAFKFPKTPSMLFTAFNGGVVWDIHVRKRNQFMARHDLTGLGLCEYRLKKAFFHCPVPFWGIRRAKELQLLSASQELKRWSIGGNYDRPICRRIIEEAGIPREWFGVQKKATSFSPVAERRPINKLARQRFEHFIRERGIPLAPQWLLRSTSVLDEEIISRLSEITNINIPRLRINSKAEKMTFQWAVSELVATYKKELISE